jgi:hypothetical protein
MTTFTIDETNNISAFASPEEAAAAGTTPFDSFASQQELAELAKAWPAERLLAILNSLPGEKPAKKLKDPKTAASRIWKRIQGLGEAAQPEPEPAKPKAEKKAKGRAQSAKGAPSKAKATKKATPAKATPKGKKGAKPQEAAGPRQRRATASRGEVQLTPLTCVATSWLFVTVTFPVEPTLPLPLHWNRTESGPGSVTVATLVRFE